jgi:integrase/recombinase XerD
VAGGPLVTRLEQSLVEYLTVRRALGYKLENAEPLLGQFLAYLQANGEEQITTERALAWATLPASGRPWHSQRLRAVRGFARYLHAVDPEVQVPPVDLLAPQRHRATPYLYSDEQIAALIAAAASRRTPHRVATWQTLIGLLAATGMRIGEAIGLDRHDFDHTHGVLVVCGKFGKTRELALHSSTVQALRRYLRRRDRPASPASERALLISMSGKRLDIHDVEKTFSILRRLAAIEPRSGTCRPTLHGLRHTFAVRTLLDAYRSGEDVHLGLVALSTYMGHIDPANTYWYLHAAPELMSAAAERLERHMKDPR